ncbi:MAG: hypothetical protein ACXABF_15575 [Candidatus Thorarchaeota archaeon]
MGRIKHPIRPKFSITVIIFRTWDSGCSSCFDTVVGGTAIQRKLGMRIAATMRIPNNIFNTCCDSHSFGLMNIKLHGKYD